MPELHVLVCGATGDQGGAVARALIGRGHRVTALTRDPSKPAARAVEAAGATLAGGDLTDRADCERVQEGIDVGFLMGTPYESGPDAEVRQGITFAEAAAARGLGHLVYSSAANARDDTGLPSFETKATVERRIEDLGITHPIVAPVYFRENLLRFGGLQGDRMTVPLSPERPVQQLAVADVGAFVALVLDDLDRFAGRRIEIAGDEVTGSEMASIVGERLGRPIEYVPVPLEAVRSQSEALEVTFRWYEDVGHSVDIAALRDEYPEVGWHDYRNWVREQDLGGAD